MIPMQRTVIFGATSAIAQEVARQLVVRGGLFIASVVILLSWMHCSRICVCGPDQGKLLEVKRLI